ncbi:MAG: hypothetical protein K9G58_05195 [Bacteroidales bacterium]|nr:hypothetical protein [Bacteroidales bacterium]MCF8387726.1 hypothetical protein [Bacteroidales bacterium]MCF8397542.1 hypothetical protein [Bacteroidales bacterium]
MKKLILQIIVYTTLAVYLPASNLPFILNEEDNVPDIPFDTKKIASHYLVNADGDDKKLEEESYVDDIPFNTQAIASDYLVNNTDLELEEEDNVDDIPFNTICYLIDKVTFNDVRAKYLDKEVFRLILQLPNNERFTFVHPEDFTKSFMECVLEKPKMDFRTSIKDIQHKFPQTMLH